MNTFTFVAFKCNISSLTQLRLVAAIRIDGRNSEIKRLIAKSPDRKARASLIARSTIDFRMNIYKKYPLLPTTFSVEIFFVEDIFEMLELLAELDISVIPVCFTSDRKSKDCSTIHS